jgi:hypothetical protein
MSQHNADVVEHTIQKKNIFHSVDLQNKKHNKLTHSVHHLDERLLAHQFGCINAFKKTNIDNSFFPSFTHAPGDDLGLTGPVGRNHTLSITPPHQLESWRNRVT